MKELIRKYFTAKLYKKTILWTDKVRIFCDGGEPIWRWFPRFHRAHYDKHWGMRGFRMYLFGREVNFSFGTDVNGLYKDKK